jgi:PAS domain S-box-containing protein
VRDCLAYSKPRLRLETQIQNRTISWSYFPVALNQVVHCYAGDITERKRAEEQMNLQSSALTAAANAIAITDRNGEIEWVNPSFIKLTGYSAAEVIGKTLRVVKSGQNSQNFYANLWATIVAGNVWHGELINRHKNGRLYTEDMTITSVRGADGQIAHFVAIKQDVTERREFENRLQQAQKMEAIGTLAGGIAHDFNNILAIMFGNAGLLQRDLMENPSAQESINEILNAANRAKDLVQQILTFSRRREHNRQTIRLYTVVKEAVKFLRASLPANIKIETNLAAEAPRVLADPTQIYQVAVNLGTNALHAMEGQSGRLVVSLDTFQPDEKFIQAHPGIQPIPHARLTFADTGHGIDAKTLERIFEPFFTTKPVGQGTGLGLAVVHGIVQSHQGVITVESQPGQGTTFCVYFPARADAVALTDSPDVNFDPGHGEHILLLDDEPSLTLVFKLHLLRLNYQVTVSNNARETINLFRQNPAQFDLFITDLTMPEMNGLEVARQVHLIRPDLPIVLASGFAPDLTQMNLRDAGIRELLQKPVSLTTLNKLLARFFDKSVRPI